MTASAAESCGGRGEEEEKKREPGTERERELVSIREGEKGGARGAETEKHVRQHVRHIQPLVPGVRSFGSL